MKREIALLSIILTMTCCEKTDNYPSLDNYRLTKILNYSKSTDSEPKGFVEFEYDENGNLGKESMFDYPNTLYTYKEYAYENNILQKKSIYDGQVGNLKLGTYIQYEYENEKPVKEELFSADGTLKYTTYYEFNGNKLVNTYKTNDELGIHHQYKYTYDSSDRLILEETFMYNQQRDGYTKYYYDDSNRMIKTEIFENNGTLIQTVAKKYVGSSILPSEELYFDPNGSLSQTRHLLYDNLDNLTETIIIDSQGTNSLFKKKYNGKLLIEYIQYIPSFRYSEWYVNQYEYSKI